MICRRGDIVLVKFPFTTLLKAKKRPVLVMGDQNEYGDFICFQITSKSTQSKIYTLHGEDFTGKHLPLKSYVKYDKCFTLNIEIVDKQLATVNDSSMDKIKELFCAEI